MDLPQFLNLNFGGVGPKLLLGNRTGETENRIPRQRTADSGQRAAAAAFFSLGYSALSPSLLSFRTLFVISCSSRSPSSLRLSIDCIAPATREWGA